MKKNVIRLDIIYNGTHFKGYQKQTDARTVQGEVEKCLALIYQESITVFCSGRTDTGVHALHQVLSFKAPSSIKIPSSNLYKALNSLLPSDIKISCVKNEHAKFHARFSPKSRTYLYIINNTLYSSPFEYEQAWHYSQKINIKKLKKTLKQFIGTHSFQAFCEKPSTRNYERTILNIKVKQKKHFIYIYIEGNAFLRRMIRNIIGTSITIASKNNLNYNMVNNLLQQTHRNQNPFPTAPACGLYFFKVKF